MALLSTDMIKEIRKVAEEYSRIENERRIRVGEELKQRERENPFEFSDQARFLFD
tara:strand:+ start:463 stop:627 length:165 start_codon:yes stop_codon:yes gene_type:complete